MTTVLQKWGNSLALRIPRAYANEIAVAEGQPVDVRVTRGRLVIAPIAGKTYELSDLVAGITRKNRHAETDSSSARGKEVW
ncbi:MAG TPA: AbrB/MazE/SpoVT family DNA-binding domain-containing protein [Chthoniobacterales bacterium]|nr:AbrB/MazE/SpoVT family DNA-binding domain-containing protein [Chthoniobacterales bacterium]